MNFKQADFTKNDLQTMTRPELERLVLELQRQASLSTQDQFDRADTTGMPESDIVAEETLHQNEEKYRSLFENMAEEVHFWKLVRDEAGSIKTWRLVDANPPALKTWGYTSVEEIRGKTPDEIFGPDATEHYITVVRKIFTDGVPHSFEDHFPNLDKYFRFTCVPLGEYFITTGADITPVKKAEITLRESEERFRLALKNSPVLVAMQDKDLVYRWAYNTQTRLPEEVVGKTDADLFAPEDIPAILEAKRSVLQTGKETRLQCWATSNGQRVFLDCSYEPIIDSAGKITGIGITVVNLTEQKTAVEALTFARESARQRLAEIEDLYHNAPVGLCVLNRDLRFLRINERLAEINGIPAADHIGKTVRDVLPGLANAVEPGMRRILETGEPRLNLEIISETSAHPGVQRSWLEQWLPIKDSEGRVTGLSIVVEEVTEHKRAEEDLKKMSRILSEGQKIAHLGSFEFIAATGATIWSEC